MHSLPNINRTRGQSIVEMTLIVPVLLLIIFGMVDFAMAFTTHIKIRNAVAEGGYFAAQNPGNETGIRAQIRQELSDLDPAITDADITITPCVATSTGFETEIGVAYQYQFFFGLAGNGPNVILSNDTTVPQFGGCH